MQKDITEKCLESCNDVFADIYNALVFGGRTVLDPEQLISLPTESFTRNHDGTLRQGNRDIRKADLRNGHYRLICAVENQDGPDNTMPQRLMGYDYASYEEQIRTLKKENQKSGNPAYTKQLHAGQKLAPVLNTVLYWGTERWETPLCLHDMLEFPPETEELLRPLVAEYIACKNNPDALEKLMQNQEIKIRHPEEFLDTLKALTRDKRYEKIAETILKKEEREEITMFSIAEVIENRGMERGLEYGIERGEYSKLISLVCRKLTKGNSAAEIADMLEEPLDLVKKICLIAENFAPEYDVKQICQEFISQKDL